MNFITFSTQFTNAFPMSNSVNGGQLVTEYNLKSRESVSTDPKIAYNIGPSFVHSETDFEVKVLQDAGGAIINSYTLSIAEGRGVINGHFVETLAPMTIDLIEANAKLADQSRPLLKGALAIGIRTFFATEHTISGSILVENDEDMFLGIQLVILPVEEMVTPIDSPLDQSKVTCDLVLATFTFLNNSISDILNVKSKLEYMSPDRIRNIDDIISARYVTKHGLNPKKLYAFAGKGIDPVTGEDTWEDVTDSVMIWDADPERTLEKPTATQTEIVTTDHSAQLIVPHKQVTGMTDDDGNLEYYKPKVLDLPIADYASNSTGFVTKEYTRQIKAINAQVQKFRNFVNGKQIQYMAVRDLEYPLPAINDAWNIGDYILVGSDVDYVGVLSELETAPSTMYVILPGFVRTIQYIGQQDGDAIHEPTLPENIEGVELVYLEWYQNAGQEEPETEIPEYYPDFFGDGDEVRGVVGDPENNVWKDYFRIRYFREDAEAYGYTDYYYGVQTSGPRGWSEAMLLTGSIPLATEQMIGGFLNASEEAVDYGYVYLDETGHLRLIDYALLRSGTLAYQIGEDFALAKTDSLQELQYQVTRFINERVAFPTETSHGSNPSILNIYIPLPADGSGILEISGIDSRFNTAVCLHFTGKATSKITINISDCEKLMIDPTIEGNPIINVYRTCLYYDPLVLNYVRMCERPDGFKGFKDLSLWYEKVTPDSPSLVVNGMTVSEIDSPIITTHIDFWKELHTAINDNSYKVALKSITFSGEGDIVGCEILAANNSTDNIEPGDKIAVGTCSLPQGENLIYPVSCLTRKLKVSGSFTSAYYSDESWYVTDNSFSFESDVYDETKVHAKTIEGVVAFHSVTSLIPSTIPQTSISPWETDTYHIFKGGAIS